LRIAPKRSLDHVGRDKLIGAARGQDGRGEGGDNVALIEVGGDGKEIAV
jgi:hypothetical protein